MANVKISELPAATSVDSPDSFVFVQGGVTKQAAKSVLFASPTFTGTATAAILTATGDVSFDGGAFVFNDSGADRDARFEGETDANLLFVDASTDRVGIGTSSPAAKLHMLVASATNVELRIGNNQSYASIIENAVGEMQIYTPGTAITFSTNGAEQMRLDASGNLGIGTATPQQKLVISNGGAAGLEIGPTVVNSAPALVSYNRSGATWTQLTYSALAHVWQGSGSEVMRLDTSGNLGIGVTPSAWGSDYKALQIGASATAALSYKNFVTSLSQNVYSTNTQDIAVVTGRSVKYELTGAGDYVWKTASVTTAGAAISWTQAMTLDASGFLFCPGVYNNTTGSAANVFVASNGLLQRSTSSLKYKTDVQDAVHGLAEVMRLRSVTYKGKTDGDKVFGGLIAEEVDAIGLTEFVQYAEDGSPDALAYGNMVALLTKAIQEQQALITALTARVTALEAG